MIAFEDFGPADFQRLKSWIKDEEALTQFAGPLFTYPLTDEQLYVYLEIKTKRIYKVVAEETGDVIGHCELNFENEIPRLSRILIGDPAWRGKGLGERVVVKMAELIFEDPEVQLIDLRVFEWNKSAIRCYEKVGFRVAPELTTQLDHGSVSWTRYTMTLARSDFR